MAGYVPPGRQVVLSHALHEFRGCGHISQWSMIFGCTAPRDGNVYPLELQVFSQIKIRRFRLLSSVQVNLQDEHCERQLAIFNVSIPICQGDHVGMYVPDMAGLTGLGYRETGNSWNSYLSKEFSGPPLVGERVMYANSDYAYESFPLVSIEGMLFLLQ